VTELSCRFLHSVQATDAIEQTTETMDISQRYSRTARYTGCCYLLDPQVLARRSSDLLLCFIKFIITAIIVYLPSSNVQPSRHTTHDATLAERQAKRWAGACRSSRKEKTPSIYRNEQNFTDVATRI